MAAASKRELKRENYECFILVLSVLSIVNLVLLLILPLPESREIIRICDVVLSGIFLLDFGFRLVSAPGKREYLIRQHGWLDFFGSLPFPGLRLARLFRVLRVARLLRRYGIQRFRQVIVRDRAGSTLVLVLTLTLVLIELSSVLVLGIEAGAKDANILTPSDALWWTYVTVATVGYGDRYPVTDPGRVVGVVTLTVGVVLYGALAAFLANAFTRSPANEGGSAAPYRDELRAEFAEIVRRELRALRDESIARQAPSTGDPTVEASTAHLVTPGAPGGRTGDGEDG
jgi:voltage-gated potassium channel